MGSKSLISLFECSSVWDLEEEFREGNIISLFLPYFRAKLASTIAENEEKELENSRQYAQELRVLIKQLQSLTLFLQTKLKEKVMIWVFLLFPSNCIFEQRWFHSFLPNLYISYFLFLSYCISYSFHCDVQKEWQEGTSLLYT